MSQSHGEGAPVSGAGSESSGVVQTAKDEAVGLTETAAEQAGAVVETAKTEVGAVAHEAKDQVAHLYRQSVDELRAQAAVQQRRVADGLTSVGGELHTMASNSDGGVAADLVRQASTKVQGVASWLGERDPGSLLAEVKSYARRKPGTFIAVAAAAGLVAGRLARALSESAKESSDSTAAASPGAAPVTPPPVDTGSPIPPGEPTGLPDSAGGARHDPVPGAGSSLESGGTADDTPLFDRTGAVHDTGPAQGIGGARP